MAVAGSDYYGGGLNWELRAANGGKRPQKAENAAARKEEEVGVRQLARRGCGSSRRALLGGEGTVGRRSDPVTIEHRGGARRWQRCSKGSRAGQLLRKE
ncbi:hypothetical protein B296_00025549 [Ensete ventricosum]|uniref:Uncharacterized protein n=1 Tax=Ensete ventricosum TaxID=4639 RepID=A0A426YJK3_ENSVE|nr:hypothetical protein B296_00025549 [Ensete ventricosum]